MTLLRNEHLVLRVIHVDEVILHNLFDKDPDSTLEM